jgi:hypothetical protein
MPRPIHGHDPASFRSRVGAPENSDTSSIGHSSLPSCLEGIGYNRVGLRTSHDVKRTLEVSVTYFGSTFSVLLKYVDRTSKIRSTQFHIYAHVLCTCPREVIPERSHTRVPYAHVLCTRCSIVSRKVIPCPAFTI